MLKILSWTAHGVQKRGVKIANQIRSNRRLHKDSVEEPITMIHCILITNPLRFYRNSIKEPNESW